MKLVVLNDGETYTDITGCVIVDFPDDRDAEDIEAWLPDAIQDGLDIEAVLAVYEAVDGMSGNTLGKHLP
jgi:hypothetical protein